MRSGGTGGGHAGMSAGGLGEMPLLPALPPLLPQTLLLPPPAPNSQQAGRFTETAPLSTMLTGVGVVWAKLLLWLSLGCLLALMLLILMLLSALPLEGPSNASAGAGAEDAQSCE